MACGCTCHRCEGYDVWIHTFGYGDTRGCLYDPANGKLVGGRWGTDTTFQDCWFLYWGAAATIPQGCFTSSTTPGCAPADAGRD